MITENKEIIELEAEKVRFFSQYDENAFFDWVKKIPSVKASEGRGLSIFLCVDNEDVDEEDLRELISLFWRYNVSMKQLLVFNRKPFSEWFHDKNAYWFCKVFSEKK